MERRLPAGAAAVAVAPGRASSAYAQTAPDGPGSLSQFDLAPEHRVGVAHHRDSELRQVSDRRADRNGILRRSRFGSTAQLDYTRHQPLFLSPVVLS
jgi:hypothetical protein